MPRFTTHMVTSAVLMAIVAAAGYLLGTWWKGEWIRYYGGVVEQVRQDWRLGAALLLIAITAAAEWRQRGETRRPR